METINGFTNILDLIESGKIDIDKYIKEELDEDIEFEDVYDNIARLNGLH